MSEQYRIFIEEIKPISSELAEWVKKQSDAGKPFAEMHATLKAASYLVQTLRS
jgi:hypothetical protein